MIIDLSHPIRDGMPAYPGLPPARVSQLLSHDESRARYEDRAEFALSRIDIATNTATYLDSPWHRHVDSYDIGSIPLDRVANLRGLVVDAAPQRKRDGLIIVLDKKTVAGAALLIRTGWSERWGTEAYWTDGPYLAPQTVESIVAAQPSVVGVDCSNVDDTRDPERPVHTSLLGADILVVEHLTNLAAVSGPFHFHCAPLQVEGAASMPVRAYAVTEGDE